MSIRPIYESENDMTAEEETALKCAELFKAECKKLPKLHPLDFAFLRDGHICSFAEIKCRTCRHDEYKTYMLSLDKMIKARMVTAFSGVPCLLIVRWSNRIGFIDMKTEYNSIAMGGRSDRNDTQDIEPVIHWNVDKFTFINHNG